MKINRLNIQCMYACIHASLRVCVRPSSARTHELRPPACTNSDRCVHELRPLRARTQTAVCAQAGAEAQKSHKQVVAALSGEPQEQVVPTEKEGGRERVSERESVCVCVCLGERERVCVRVCACVFPPRERE